jgi:hypothetical protein
MIRNTRLFPGVALVALALTLLPQPASAWNDAGHRLIALVAWERLDDPTRAAIVHVLKSHERFGEDFKGRMPQDIRDADAATRNRWIFVQAAVWPDIARDFTGSLRTKHHQATWHYISQPIFLADTEQQALWKQGLPVNLGMQWSPTMRFGEMNVIQALQRTRAQLRNPAAPSSEKALALTWLFHLVGDLHQPTHSTSIFSLGRFREGDRGRREIATTVGGNLHAYWDGILGIVSSLALLDTQVREWIEDDELRQHGETAAATLDEARWMTESVMLASTAGYDEALREALIAAEDDHARDLEPFEIADSYAERAERSASRRAVEAGYRLAEVLKGLFPSEE